MVTNGSVETTQALMKAADVVVATGGGAMVKAAYSSGKPSYGVGAGNVPVIIDRDVDLTDAAEKIVAGASFDNGIICSHEQFVLTPEERYEETIETFLATGKVWFTADKSAGAEAPRGRLPGRPPEQGRGRQVGARDRQRRRALTFPKTYASSWCRQTAPGRRTSWPRRSSARSSPSCPIATFEEAVGSCQSQPAGRRRRALGGAALEQRGAHPPHGPGAADQPARREPGLRADRRRFAHERLCAHDDTRLRLLGRQLDLREPGLQAPDERVADRQAHHGKKVPTDDEIWA